MSLVALVEAELAEPVSPRVMEMAAAIAAVHGTASRAVVFYGSCLRQNELDGLMLDFYLIVSDYSAAYPKSWLATANRLIPPNVFPFAHGGLAAKYAVLSESDFAALNSPDASTVSVWARFAQPTRLVWHSDEAARVTVINAIAKAAPTLFHFARPIAASDDPVAIWRAGFAQTYKAEIRAEREDRSGLIVDADPARYARFGESVPSDPAPLNAQAAQRAWRALQRRGKWISILRLAKASFTFAGGIDYLAWKVNRHAGTDIEIKPWQRRWPLIAALTLVPRLFAKGAVR